MTEIESDSGRKKRWLTAVAGALAPHGFAASGRTLWRRQQANWALVSFDWIRREEPRTGFYCFVGITSEVIAGFDGVLRDPSVARPVGKRPKHAYECELFSMLQMFAPDGNLNTLWHIDSTSPSFYIDYGRPEGSVEDILADVMKRFDAYALPLLDKLQSDEQLRDYLVAGGRFGNIRTVYKRAILTRILGNQPEFDRAIEELRQLGLDERETVGMRRLLAGDLDGSAHLKHESSRGRP